MQFKATNEPDIIQQNKSKTPTSKWLRRGAQREIHKTIKTKKKGVVHEDLKWFINPDLSE